MGTCLSKKSITSSSPIPLPDPQKSVTKSVQIEPEKNKSDEEVQKKEIFVIKHRKSNDRRSDEEKSAVVKVAGVSESGSDGSENGVVKVVAAATPLRASSCTTEEVDAILIQCGRLSRSSSMGKVGPGSAAGTPQRGKMYSGSKRSFDFDNENRYDDVGDEDEAAAERIHRHRQRHRQGRAAGSSASPSGRRRTPSRERDQQNRSNSRERAAAAAGGSGGRRVSRSPGRRSEPPLTSGGSAAANPQSTRPGKMISVPAVDKGSNGGGASAEIGVRRIQVKRNQSPARANSPARAKSPARANSPARMNLKNSIENQALVLSRSNSRKAESSPYRRNPLSDIDNNIAGFESNKIQTKKTNTVITETDKDPPVTVNLIENPKPTLTRTRSARQSRDLDINPETLLNPNPSYTTLLLEDIQNFHQKNHNPTPSFSLPPCLTKACSILEAVADLTEENSSTRGKKRVESSSKDPIMESQVMGGNDDDDLLQPSFHKYVTVRGGTDNDELESSGSNSYVFGGMNHWEPNSADTSDCYTSTSKSKVKEDSVEKKRESNHEHSGIGRGRVGIGRGLYANMSN